MAFGSDLHDYVFIEFIFPLMKTTDSWWRSVALGQKVTLLPQPSDTSETITSFFFP